SGSAHATTPEQVNDRQQDNRTYQRHQQSGDTEITAVDIAANTQHAADPAANEGADDADDDVEEDALLAIGLHDHAGNPADDAAYDQPNDDTHHVRYSLVHSEGGKRTPAWGRFVVCI